MNDERLLWTADALAAHEFETPTYLIEPMVPLGGVVMLHGKRGVGKSQFCLTVGNAIINELPLFGRWPTLQGPVVIVQVDMTPMIQQIRIHKIVNKLDLTHLYFSFPPSIDITRLHAAHGRLLAAIREINPVLVIWDTLRRIHRMDENDSTTVQVVYNAARINLPDTTHMFVHHDKKTPNDPSFTVDPEEQFRGAGDWIDSGDTSVQLRFIGKRTPRRIGMLFHKARTAPDEEKVPMVLEMDTDNMLLLPMSHTRADVEGLDREERMYHGLRTRRDSLWNLEEL